MSINIPETKSGLAVVPSIMPNTQRAFSVFMWIKSTDIADESGTKCNLWGLSSVSDGTFPDPTNRCYVTQSEPNDQLTVETNSNLEHRTRLTVAKNSINDRWTPMLYTFNGVYSPSSGGETVLYIEDGSGSVVSNTRSAETLSFATDAAFLIGKSYSAIAMKIAGVAIWDGVALSGANFDTLRGGANPQSIETSKIVEGWNALDDWGASPSLIGFKSAFSLPILSGWEYSSDNPPISVGPTTRPGISIPDCYGPNADTFPADSAAVVYRMYDKQPDGTETLLGRGTDGAFTAGAITIDNALAGSVGGTGWVDVFWAAGADTLSWSGPYTVIDLDA